MTAKKKGGWEMKNIKLLWNHMDGNKLTYLGAILSVGLAALFTMLGPLVIRVTIDSIIGGQPVTAFLPNTEIH